MRCSGLSHPPCGGPARLWALGAGASRQTLRLLSGPALLLSGDGADPRPSTRRGRGAERERRVDDLNRMLDLRSQDLRAGSLGNVQSNIPAAGMRRPRPAEGPADSVHSCTWGSPGHLWGQCGGIRVPLPLRSGAAWRPGEVPTPLPVLPPGRGTVWQRQVGQAGLARPPTHPPRSCSDIPGDEHPRKSPDPPWPSRY